MALPSEVVWEAWSSHEAAPELGCVTAWSEACRAWWEHPSDRRLRQRVGEQLFLGDDELVAWRAFRLDQKSLVQAHTHVTASRAGAERTTIRRTLTAGALRTTPVVSYQRSGRTMAFPAPAALPGLIAELTRIYDALPVNPFVRAAWISQAIGAVHPFVDANGGTARFLSSLELSRVWLPPFVLTELQRNTTYADAIVEADQDPGRMFYVVYDVVQQELAALLVVPHDGTPASWDERVRVRASAWVECADSAWRAAAQLPVTMDEGGTATLARFARRGYRLPYKPGPKLVRWSSTTPLSFQFELAISPVRAGDAIWTIASVVATVGDEGALGRLVVREPIATVFVGAPTESEAALDARFERWIAKRIEQSVRGLAAWM